MAFQDKSEKNQKVLNSPWLVSPGQSNQKVTLMNFKHRFLCEVTWAFALLRSALHAEASSASPSLLPVPLLSLAHTHWVVFSSSTLDPLLLTRLARFRHWKKTSNILLPRLESLFPFSFLILLLSLLLSHLPLLFTLHLFSPPTR